MAKKLYEESAVEAIADAIRAKNGGSATYKISEMAAAVGALGASEKLPAAEYPDYVKAGALEVARKVAAVRKSSSIVFAAFSDPHHATDETTGWKTAIETGNRDGCRALRALAHVLPLDFAVFLGDLTFGHYTTTAAQFEAQCKEFHGWADEALRGVPAFWTPGNHDTGEYLAKAWTASDGTTRAEDLSKLYGSALIKKYFSDFNTGAVMGDAIAGYCYRDFDSKKLRVICLDTVEAEITAGESATATLSDAQLLWFAETLKSLGEKSDAAAWSFIIIGHYPLDWGYTRHAGDILAAYLAGTSVTLSGTTVSFSGKNSAVFCGNFHGHLHNFKSGKIYKVANSLPNGQMDALRICCPSMNYYRTNEVGDNGQLDSNGIEFGEDTTHAKTEGAKDTSFTVNVIDPTEKKIYSFCYGAGYDRTLSYDFTVTMRSVTLALTHCTASDPATAVEDGAAYSVTLTPDAGYELSSVVVTMGGTDITASAYSAGVVTVANVTGDIVITASAVKHVNYTNLVASAVDSSGASAPYQDGYSLASSGAASAYGSQYTCTGFIPISDGNTAHIYRIAGDGVSFSKTDEYDRIAWYDASFALLKNVLPAKRIDSSTYYPTTIAESTTAMTFKVTDASGTVVSNVPASAAYFRVGATGSGANLIVTLDEEIK